MVSKPAKLQTIAILWIADGVLSISWGIGLAAAAIGSIIGIFCLPVALYPLVLGIIEVVYGAKLLNDPVKLNKAPTFVPIMQIVDIALGDVIGLVVGIVTLSMLNDAAVKAYFAQQAAVNM